MRRQRRERRQLVDDARHFVAARSRRGRRRAGAGRVIVPSGSPAALAVLRRRRRRRPTRRRTSRDRRARRVQADVLDLDLRARERPRPPPARTPPTRCRPARDRSGRAAAGRPRRSTPCRVRSTSDAERGERPLRMVARGRRLDDARRAVGVEAGEQHRALDLGARHVGLDSRSACRCRALRRVSGGRPSVGLDPRAHARQRLDDAAHRAARQRRVADHRRCETDAGQDARQQPHRRAGIAGVERRPRARARPPSPRPSIAGSTPVARRRLARWRRRAPRRQRASSGSRRRANSREIGTCRRPAPRAGRSGGRSTCPRRTRTRARGPRRCRGASRTHGDMFGL